MANVPKPLRMPIQLMCGKCQRAQRASANRMCARSRDADGPSVRHTNSKAARLWTQSTEGLLYLYRTARRLRNPRPVLAPYRNIIQYFPGNRGCEQACRGSRAPYQQILIDGAVEAIPQAIIDQLDDGGRLGTAIVDRGITRLVVGRKARGAFGTLSFGDAGVPALPGFSRPKAFKF